MTESYDVIVIGGGNAALCAALEARHYVDRVLILERAPFHMRGGNTRHTRNIRCAQETGNSAQRYPCDEFMNDLIGVTGAPVNPTLANYAIRQSEALPQWMEQHGIAWQPPVAGTLHLGRTNRWFLGGGKTLANSYFLTAEKMKIEVRYEACVELLAVKNGRFEGVVLTGGEQVRGKAVVIAAGGFEANLEWLRRYWGDAVENFCVRGTPFNDGKMLQVLFDLGAKPIGDQKGFHAIAVDARAPKFDGGIVTRLDAIPFGIVVNCLGQRFADEGANIWPKRYASWGRLIAEQPRQSAYCIVDSKTIRSFLPPIYPPAQSSTIGKLAIELGLNPDILTETVLRYNAATQGNSGLRSDRLDGLCTRQLDPPKSNWAVPLDRPPFYGLPLKPGITFTYLGVEIDEEGHIVRTNGGAYENIFAAGEIMAGNILTKGYLAGFGLTIGSVFGRLAGKGASAYAVG